jgi:hypothetical protein
MPAAATSMRTSPAAGVASSSTSNLRRGLYDLGTHVRPTARLADAFAELAIVI